MWDKNIGNQILDLSSTNEIYLCKPLTKLQRNWRMLGLRGQWCLGQGGWDLKNILMHHIRNLWPSFFLWNKSSQAANTRNSLAGKHPRGVVVTASYRSCAQTEFRDGGSSDEVG